MTAGVLALSLGGCDGQSAAEDWCENFARRTDVTEFVNQQTGRLDRDPTTNEIIYPDTGRIALTRSQEECLRREAQKAIDRYEGK